MAKNGWGAARDGKVLLEKSEEYGSYKESNVKSSKDLKGQYAQFQGKTLGGSNAEGK